LRDLWKRESPRDAFKTNRVVPASPNERIDREPDPESEVTRSDREAGEAEVSKHQ